MSFLRAITGYALAGLVVQLVWPWLATPAGYFAGVVGAIVAIGPVWYLVHYRGWIPNKDSHLAVDMGAAIGTTVLVRGIWTHGFSAAMQATPTLLCLLMGASIAGWTVAALKRRNRS